MHKKASGIELNAVLGCQHGGGFHDGEVAQKVAQSGTEGGAGLGYGNLGENAREATTATRLGLPVARGRLRASFWRALERGKATRSPHPRGLHRLHPVLHALGQLRVKVEAGLPFNLSHAREELGQRLVAGHGLRGDKRQHAGLTVFLIQDDAEEGRLNVHAAGELLHVAREHGLAFAGVALLSFCN